MSAKRRRVAEFARKRAERVEKADSLISWAEKFLSSSPEAAAQSYRAAARTYGRSGLGIMARTAFQQASKQFSLAGRASDAEDCQTLASAVDIIWAGEGL
jgi:hypothetical protein